MSNKDVIAFCLLMLFSISFASNAFLLGYYIESKRQHEKEMQSYQCRP